MSDPNPRPPPPDRALRPAERLGAALLLAGAAVATAFILFPWGGLGPVPGEDSLGRPAPLTVRAPRDLAVQDEAATERRRADAARAEPRVYDHDLSSGEEVEARIRGAFQLMRDTERRWRERRGLDAPPGRRESRADAADLARDQAAQRAEFASRLHQWVDDPQFAALAETRFSAEAERWLLAAVRAGQAGLVVEDRSLLAADREAGIRVRDVGAGEVHGERSVADVAGLGDLAAARARVAEAVAGFDGASPRLRAALEGVAVAMLRPSLVLSQSETERRRRVASARVAPAVVQVHRGEVVLSAGERVEGRHLEILRALQEQDRLLDRASLRIGGGLLAGASLMLLWIAAARLGGTLRPRRRGALLLVGLYLAALGVASIGTLAADRVHGRVASVAIETFSLAAPAPAAAALAAMLLSPAAGVLLAVAIGIAVSLVGSPSVLVGLQVTLAAVAAALLLARVRRRAHVWRAGAAVGALQSLLLVAAWLVTGRARLGSLPPELAAAAAAAFVSGALAGPVLVLLARPLLESIFGLASDLRLRDLASLNHPALKELIVQAPGTWHHSVVTAALAEAGARAAGADPLLARAGAYFHDLGKGRDPSWFSENGRGENPHADLQPARSAAIVRRHVEDGVAAARRWKLPRAVVDIVAQHHGTRLVSYFWSKEAAGAAAGTERPELEASFRYAGPRPQTREAALVMIADTCEASSRDLPDTTPEKLLALVRRRIAEVVDEGQLDECDLTLRDLEAAARAMAAELDALTQARATGGARPADRRSPLQLVRP